MDGGVHRCDRCGATSDLAAGFTGRLTFSGRRSLCVTCQRDRGRRLAGALTTVLLAPPLVVAGDLALSGRLDLVWQEPGWLVATTAHLYRTASVALLGDAPLWTAALFVVLLVHETGHALAARLVGDEVAEISLGLGPVVAQGGLAGTRLVLRLLPVMGHTLIVPTRGVGTRRRQLVGVAAGPVAHASVVAAAVLAGPAAGFTRHLAWIGGVSLLMNLVPYRAGGAHPTDGLQLLALARGSGTAPDGPRATRDYSRAVAAHLARDLDEARRCCERGLAAHPGDTATEALLVAILVELDQPGEARRRARRLLDEELPPERRAATECNLACADLLLGDPDLVPEAAEAVTRAYATLPWEPSVQAARAFVAITQGRIEEGMGLVSHALEAEGNPSQRSGMLAVRAIGYARVGRFREADGDVRAAVRLQPDDVLVARAVDEIARCVRAATGGA